MNFELSHLRLVGHIQVCSIGRNAQVLHHRSAGHLAPAVAATDAYLRTIGGNPSSGLLIQFKRTA